MDLLSGITKMLGTTLDLREILPPVGEAVRPAIAFDAMGVIMLDTSGWKWAFFGTAGEPPVPGIERIPAAEFSYAAALMAGRPSLRGGGEATRFRPGRRPRGARRRAAELSVGADALR